MNGKRRLLTLIALLGLVVVVMAASPGTARAAGSLDHFEVVADPGTPVAGVPFTFTVTAKDATDAVIPDYAPTASIAVTGLDGSDTAVITGLQAAFDANGQATFTVTFGLSTVAPNAGSARTLVVSDGTPTGSVVVSTVAPGPLAQLAVSGSSTATAGVPETYTIDFMDAEGNLLANLPYTGLTLTGLEDAADHPDFFSAAADGAADVNGQAFFDVLFVESSVAPNLGFDRPLGVTIGGVSGQIATPVVVNPGPFYEHWLVGSMTVVAGVTETYTIYFADEIGNVIPNQAYDSITISDSEAEDELLQSSFPAGTADSSGGVSFDVIFHGSTIAPNSYPERILSITVVANSITDPCGWLIPPVYPGQLVDFHEVSMTAGPVTAGTEVTWQINAVDQYNNIIPSYDPSGCDWWSTDPHLEFTTYSVDLGTGVISINAIVREAGPQRVGISDPVYVPVEVYSSPVTVEPGPFDHVITVSEPAAAAVAGDTVTWTVQAVDAFDNPVDHDGTGVVFTSTGGPAPVAGTWSAGQVTVSAVLETTGDQHLSATANSQTLDSGLVTVTPAAFGGFVTAAEPAASVTAGNDVTWSVWALDTYGNVKTDYSGAGAVWMANDLLATTVAVGWTGGQGTFTVTLKTAGTPYLGVTDGLYDLHSADITVNPDHPASFNPVADPATPVAAGATVTWQVEVLDEFGNLIPTYDPADATYSSTDAAIDSITAGQNLGVITIEAVAMTVGDQQLGISDATHVPTTVWSTIFTVEAGPFDHFNTVTDPAGTVVAGNTVSWTVQAVDAGDNPVTHDGTGVTFTSTDTETPVVGTWSGGQVTATAELRTTGPQHLTLTVDAQSMDSSDVLVTPTALDHFATVAQPAGTVPAGGSASWTVQVFDTYGNVKTDYDGAATSWNTNDPLVAAVAPTWADGQATFTTTLITMGTHALDLSDTGKTLTSDPITVTPGALDAFETVIEPTGPVTAGTDVSWIVRALDPYGNLIDTYAGSSAGVTSTDGQAVIGTLSFSGGEAAITANLRTAGSQTVTITDGSVTLDSAAVQVNPDVQSAFGVNPVGGTVVAGTPTTFTVTAEDKYGNVVAGYSGSPTVTSTDPDAEGIASPSWSWSAGASDISVTFHAAGTQSITVTDGSFTGTGSVPVDADQAASFTIVPSAGTIAAGSPMSFTITARDQYGNTATGYSGTPTPTCTDAAAENLTALSFTGGVVTLSNVVFHEVGDQTITVADGGVTGTSGTVSVTAGALHHFTTVTQPAATVVAGNTVTWVFEARDAYENVITGFTGGTLSSTDPLAVLPALTWTDGQASVTATLKTAGSRALSIASSGKTGTSAAVTVTAAAFKDFATVTAPSASVTPGGTVTWVVRARDAYGNAVNPTGAAIAVTSTDATASLSLSAWSNGQATISAVLYALGNQTLTITATTPDATLTSGAVNVYSPPSPPPAVIVVIHPTSISLSPTGLTLTAGGPSGSLTATVAPLDAANKSVLWSSSDSSVATVSAGVVTPHKAGAATITATTQDGGLAATAGVTVNPAEEPVIEKPETTEAPPDKDTTITGAEGAVTVEIPAGAAAETLSVSVAQVTAFDPTTTPDVEPPAGLLKIAGQVYQVTAETAEGEPVEQFQRQLTLTFKYTDEQLTEAGAVEEDLQVFYWDEDFKAWIAVPTIIDPATNTAVVAVDHLTVFAVMSRGSLPAFPDLTGNWAAADVLKLTSLKVIAGYDDGTFRPEASITREQFAKMVVLAAGLQPLDGATLVFADAAQTGDWAIPYVAAAVKAGIIKGVDATHFNPKGTVSRAQAVTMVARALEAKAAGLTLEPNVFSDQAAIPDWALGGTAFTVKYGMLGGLSGDKFGPSLPANRAQIARMLSRLMDLRFKQ